MDINTQSSKAQDRTLNQWFSKLQNGEIKLPRFQRFQAWDKKRITSLLETIAFNLPLGVTLLLEVGDEEKFVSRYLATAPDTGQRVHEHLLDGQQRLTALWRSLHNNYENESYFIYIPEFDATSDAEKDDNMRAFCQSRWYKEETKYPVWADRPAVCFKKGLIPVHLLRPMTIETEINDWVTAAVEGLKPENNHEDFAVKYAQYFDIKSALEKKIAELRERIKHYNLPFLALPSSTAKEIALQVFINMNTNTKPLSLYDVIVAEVESIEGSSLHDLQAALHRKYPKVAAYYDLGKLILMTSALLQDKLPSNTGMLDMKKDAIVHNWAKLESGLDKMTLFLENEGIYNRQLLPSNAVLAVIAALYTVIPEKGDAMGKAEILLRKYLWSAFFTDRYENQSANRAFTDYRQLKKLLTEEGYSEEHNEENVPVLNRLQHPLANIDELCTTGWPKSQNIRGRAILCVASRLGAFDFSDGSKLNAINFEKRDYHHIFPKALLKETNAKINPDLALNCALISSSTNRSLGAKSPLQYIKEKFETFDDQTIAFYLNSHLIPLTRLNEIDEQTEIDAAYLERMYHAFLRERAGLIREAAEQLCEGKHISVETVLTANTEVSADIRELDDEISRIELGTRKLILEKIRQSEPHKPVTEIVPEKTYQQALSKIESWHRKNPGAPREETPSLKNILNHMTLAEYKDILMSKRYWPLFEGIFGAKGNVTNRYTQLGTMRNKIRHDNALNTVERKDGEAAIEWFNTTLIEYLNG